MSKLQNFGSHSARKPLKKKGFLIDKITEDTFYENLLLGIIPVLKSCPFVSNVKLIHLPPSHVDQLVFWEYSKCIRLPEDLRNFYLSTDGFSLTYRFQYDTDIDNPSYVIGGININPLQKLDCVTAGETWYMAEMGTKVMIPQTRIFILAELDDHSRVVLANFNPAKPLSLWLYYKMKNFFFLCDDFTTYFKMAVAHLGVPGWQLAVLKASPPEWSVELYRMLAPGVLHKRQIFDQSVKNVIDKRIFDEKYKGEEEKVKKSPTNKGKTPRKK